MNRLCVGCYQLTKQSKRAHCVRAGIQTEAEWRACWGWNDDASLCCTHFESNRSFFTITQRNVMLIKPGDYKMKTQKPQWFIVPLILKKQIILF